MRGYPDNLIGQHFDKLEVIALEGSNGHGRIWRCKCSCGNDRLCLTSTLRQSKYMGCKACERLSRSQGMTQHGGTNHGKSHLYKCWKSIKSRCTIPSDTNFKYYGAKGIKRCAEWDDFAVFRVWAVTHGYKQHLSIDRIDPRGDYEPANCQWITRSENSRRMVEYHRPKIHTPIEALWGYC